MEKLKRLPFSFENTNSSFWVINSKGEKVLRDPGLENQTIGFDWEKYCSKQFNLDDMNYMYWENFDFYVYESIGCDYERMGCVVEKGDVVVDIGGNIGMFTRRALQREASKVIAFEPASKIFSCLLDNTPRNLVECHKMAVAGTNGTITLRYDSSTGIGGASVVQDINHDESGSENVICMTLNRLFEIGILPEQIDFMKIDCEGAEKQILDDLTDQNLNKIKKIGMEFHANLLGHEAREAITNRLASNGFSHFTLFHGNGSEVTLNFWKC